MVKQIKIGTMVRGKELPDTLAYIENLGKYGFESIEITFGGDATWITDIADYAKQIRECAEKNGMIISALGVYGNPLIPEGDKTLKSLELVIDNAALFGANVIAGFTGRIPQEPMVESIPKFKEVFTPLTARAADKGLKIAFENCLMGGSWSWGSWNVACNPTMWEKLFDAIPANNLGLEWEPCHQMTQLIEPLPQLRKWAPKVFHVHGKDATILHEVIAEKGIHCGEPFVRHRTPGFGDSNWTEIISILRQNNYEGTIDIEGWHDPVYRDELELTGQVHGLNYLKFCRGGDLIPPFHP
ncbi:MAG: sugar phosphate isomerase/epimerase [Lentisphaeria bacterium]|nr:sugar phosphate isomerase/epimerase [Lentisphaeria bacterium]